MVLQRDHPIMISGQASPSYLVEVQLGTSHGKAVADASSRWQITLPALPAGGPHILEVRCGGESLQLEDILLGDLWLCAGQSNMERPLRLSHEADSEIPQAAFPRLRLATVPRTLTSEPREETPLDWSVCTPVTAAQFSAVGYYFGREIHRATGIPIGLLDCSVGGTPIETWLPLPVLRDCAAGPAALASRVLAESNDHASQAAYERDLALWEQSLSAYYDRPAPAVPFQSRTVEGPWMRIVGPYFNGSVALERKVVLPDSWAGHPFLLHLDPLLASDVIFLNGTLVAASFFSAVASRRSYLLPAHLVRPCENTISLRLIIRKDHRVLPRTSGEARLESFSAFPRPTLSLQGEWSAHVEYDASQKPQLAGPLGHRASYIYNGMLHPILPLQICGAIWYQGEANVSRPHEYPELLRSFIRTLRAFWQQEEMPFYLVQLANLFEPSGSAKENKWAALRHAQLSALDEPSTGLALAYDIGDSQDIHPANKKDVGLRLSRLALRRHYAAKLLAENPAALPASDSGPLFSQAMRDGNSLRLHFKNDGRALAVTGGELRGFAFEDSGGQLTHVSARLDGSCVVISLDGRDADFLCFAWADDPAATLYSEDGLPALPFRLDLRPLIQPV
ncbi:sialate O-acetylesterase [soil metagenome]